MRSRTTLVMLAVLLVLAGIAFIQQRPGGIARDPADAMLLHGFDPAQVETIAITKPGGRVVLNRAAGGWTVGEERHAGDGEAVGRLLDQIKGLREGMEVSTNPARQALYQVDAAAGIVVRFEGRGGKAVAGLVVGKEGGDFTSSHVRREGEDRVLLVPVNLRGLLSRPASAWRDRRLVKFAREAITAVTVESGGTALELRRQGEGGGWTVNGRAAGKEEVEDYLSLLADLRATDFAPASEGGGAGLAPPAAVVRVQAGAESAALELGGPKEGTTQRYVRAGGGPELHLVSLGASDALLKREADFPPEPAVKK